MSVNCVKLPVLKSNRLQRLNSKEDFTIVFQLLSTLTSTLHDLLDEDCTEGVYRQPFSRDKHRHTRRGVTTTYGSTVSENEGGNPHYCLRLLFCLQWHRKYGTGVLVWGSKDFIGWPMSPVGVGYLRLRHFPSLMIFRSFTPDRTSDRHCHTEVEGYQVYGGCRFCVSGEGFRGVLE